MKVTGINPTVITSKYDDAIKLFESLGFEIRHHNDIDETVPISTRLKNKDGFTIDINESDKFPHDITLIRINVDNFDECYQMFKERGFKDVNIVEMPYYKGAHMISPSGFNVMAMQHIKEEKHYENHNFQPINCNCTF